MIAAARITRPSRGKTHSEPATYNLVDRWRIRIVAFRTIWFIDRLFRAKRFPAVRNYILATPVSRAAEPERLDELVANFNWAAAAYFRSAKCVQRAAALTLLLRSRGIPAEFVVGCRQVPFYSHAWVEVKRVPINETADTLHRLRVLDRV